MKIGDYVKINDDRAPMGQIVGHQDSGYWCVRFEDREVWYKEDRLTNVTVSEKLDQFIKVLEGK